MKFLKDSGMTMVELTIAMGLVGLVAVGGFKLMSPNTKTSSSHRLSSGEDLNTIAKLLQNRSVCKDSLGGRTVTSSVPQIGRKENGVFKVGQDLANKGFLKSMELQASAAWTPVPNEYGPVTLKVVLERNDRTITRFFPVSVQLDQNSVIVECRPKLKLSEEDIYRKVCTDAVKGSMSGSKCNWTKKTKVIVTYIPAPPPAPAGPECFGPVCDMYLSVLGRYPDAGGKAFWEEKMASNGSEWVLSGIVNSDENLGIPWGTTQWANYEADITNRGMNMEYAVKQCGVDMSC